jgi:uncharacterized DUF497 family protein
MGSASVPLARSSETPNALFLLDDAYPGENRFIAVGYVNAQPIAVVYTERGDTIRIISARKATKHEQKAYHQG